MNTTIPGTENTVRIQKNTPVEANGARFQMTIHHHTTKRNGLRTVVTTWLTDADKHNGGHPAGTVETKVIVGDMSKSTGRVLSVTAE